MRRQTYNKELKIKQYKTSNTFTIVITVVPHKSYYRLLQPESQYTGTSPSPYKRNRENNSKLSTNRDPGTPGSYKQDPRFRLRFCVFFRVAILHFCTIYFRSETGWLVRISMRTTIIIRHADQRVGPHGVARILHNSRRVRAYAPRNNCFTCVFEYAQELFPIYSASSKSERKKATSTSQCAVVKVKITHLFTNLLLRSDHPTIAIGLLQFTCLKIAPLKYTLSNVYRTFLNMLHQEVYVTIR